MAFGELYERQVALLVKAIPYVMTEAEFAMKGGTAINLFVRNLPRLSVDIDLTYIPLKNRAGSLQAIDAAMVRMAVALRKGLPGSHVSEPKPTRWACRSTVCRSRSRSPR